MMHEITELRRINNRKLYTADYLEMNGLTKKDTDPVYYVIADEITINTAAGITKGYMYGEKTWFDSRAERDAYRMMRNAERAEELKRNKIIKAITAKCKEMTTEELEFLLENI